MLIAQPHPCSKIAHESIGQLNPPVWINPTNIMNMQLANAHVMVNPFSLKKNRNRPR